TAENVEIEIKLARGIYAKETIKALYAFTDCEVSIASNLTLIKGTTPEISSVSEVLRFNTEKLTGDLQRELEIELGRYEDRLHARLLEQIFIEERLYKNIEEETSYDAVLKSIDTALADYRKQLIRPATKEDIERLLEIRIKRISRYDINKQQKEIKNIRSNIKRIKKSLKDIVGYTLSFIDGLLDKYGSLYPRNTEITSFSEVSFRKVALANQNIAYNRTTGFMWLQTKEQDTKEDMVVTCSEYDRLLLIFSTGLYKVIPVTEKLYVGPDLEWFGIVEKDLIFNIIYRDGAENLVYVKRFTTPSFILDKEYWLFPEHKRSRILLLLFGEQQYAKINLMPSSRARTNSLEICFDDYLIKNVSAKGKRVSTRVVRRVSKSTGREMPPAKKNLTLPGIEEQEEKDPQNEEPAILPSQQQEPPE
ncbi:MAG: DNA gyrase subunit A, partial [Desulforhopalus sp.]